MQIDIPELSLVVLVGASSSGKSTFARQHFQATEILSSDQCRGLVSNDENSQDATGDAFDVLHYIAAKRLKRGLLTVIDATNVQPSARKSLIELARQHHVLPVALVFDLPGRVLRDRHQQRTDRSFGEHVLRNHQRDLRQSLRFLSKEGFRHVFVMNSPEEVAAVTIRRSPLWNNRKAETGPFDIIGDVHGCYDELLELLERLNYHLEPGETGLRVTPPAGRKAVFLGDLVDRGPASPRVLRLVMDMVAAGTALCVPGNHDEKLLRKLNGKNVAIRHGLAETLAQLEGESPEFIARTKKFIDGLVSHYVLDGGRLVVAHAGLREEMQGRGSGAVRSFCLYGETTGEIDEFGLPVRYNWAAEYKGRAMVVYGHTPVPEPEWLNNTIDIDTGCVFGGRLTALRYPERELVAVEARQVYCEPVRPFLPAPDAPLSAQQETDDVPDLADVTGKRLLQTRYGNPVTIREENAIAALEVMSRWAVHPKWLIYLPPTMSPVETSTLPDTLEHPAQTFAYYREQGIRHVICEEKHMGSRAIAIVCREDAVAQRRFGLKEAAPGVVYTRTGRKFFTDPALEDAFLRRLNRALTESGFWDQFQTDWVCLDAELMPWSAKAQSLLQNQYAAVGTAGDQALQAARTILQTAADRGLDVAALRRTFDRRAESHGRYRTAYRQYCREVNGLDGWVLAPFHLLATEGRVHTSQPHTWHMETLGVICAADPTFLLATPYQVVDVEDPASVEAATTWWESLTRAGGEGMVVKPLDYVAQNTRGLVQPALKCRGREYLRIIYGPDYDAPENLTRLKSRALGRKRSLAMREFVLGLEALERFTAREPLRRVHECVFGVLALESEEVDPRL